MIYYLKEYSTNPKWAPAVVCYLKIDLEQNTMRLIGSNNHIWLDFDEHIRNIFEKSRSNFKKDKTQYDVLTEDELFLELL